LIGKISPNPFDQNSKYTDCSVFSKIILSYPINNSGKYFLENDNTNSKLFLDNWISNISFSNPFDRVSFLIIISKCLVSNFARLFTKKTLMSEIIPSLYN